MTDQILGGYKRCPDCGEVKPFSEYNKHGAHKDGLQSSCKECEKRYKKKYRENNKDKVRGYRQTYYKKNKDKKLDYEARYCRCVKHPSCPAVGGCGAEFVIFVCPICGKEFRKLKSTVDRAYEKYGQTHFYCSRACYFESRRKARQTEYEKNIKRIMKEVK